MVNDFQLINSAKLSGPMSGNSIHSAVSLVHFANGGAVLSWGGPGFALEEAVEIGRVRKPEVEGNFLERMLRVKQQPPRFEHQP